MEDDEFKVRWLVGRVTDPEGRPVVGARVVYRDVHSGLEATPGPDGGYRIDGLDSTGDEVTAAAPGHPPVVEEIAETRPGENRLDFVLFPGSLVLAGRVLDPEGRPLPCIAVEWWHDGYEAISVALRRTATDAAGRFRFEGVPEGLCRVWAEDPFRL